MPYLSPPPRGARKYGVLVSNIPPNTSMSQMRDLLEHLFPRIRQFVTGLRDQPLDKPMQATLLCETENEALTTRKELHMFTFNGYRLRTSIVDVNTPRWGKSSKNIPSERSSERGLKDKLAKIEMAKLLLEEQQRDLLLQMNTGPQGNKPLQKLKPLMGKEKKQGGNKVVGNNQKEYTDKSGSIVRLSGAKKKNVESAVRAICSDFEKIMPVDFIAEELKNDFNTMLREHVMHNMITLVAREPLLCPTKCVLRYRLRYPERKNLPFLQTLRKRFKNGEKNSIMPKKKTIKPPKAETAESGGEAYTNIKDEPKYLEWIERTANNNCWYMDYALGKVMRKAFENTKNNVGIEYSNKSFEDQPNEKKVEAAETITENGEPVEKVLQEFKDLSNIKLDDLLKKIQANEDMDSVRRYIDIRLANLVPEIRTEIILAATQGASHIILHPRMKQLGLDGQKLKCGRELHYATVATQTQVTSSFLRQFSVIGAWQSRPFSTLKYAQNNIALLSRSQYEDLLKRHRLYFKGHKVAVKKSFPTGEGEENVTPNEENVTPKEENVTSNEENVPLNEVKVEAIVDDSQIMAESAEQRTMDTEDLAEQAELVDEDMLEEPPSMAVEE